MAMASMWLAGLVSGAMALAPVQFGSLDPAPVKTKQYVSYTAEAQVVPAGKRAWLELRFHINAGFHINSHTPKSELLIPTKLDLVAALGTRVEPAEYPAGKTFSFSFDPGEKLDVYQDDFTVRVPVVAATGSHEMKGTLQYQACDHAACYPPKSLPVDVLFTAK
jgi:hypothetical protein